MADAIATDLTETSYLDTIRALRRRAWPAEVPGELHYPFGEIPLTEYLRRWAKRQPDKPAIIFYGNELTYRQIDTLSDRLAALLECCGVRNGDRVAVFMPNCPQFIIAFFGILKLGAIFVPVNPLYKAHEFAHQVNDAGVEVVIALDQIMPVVRIARSETRLRECFVTSFAEVTPDKPTLPLPTDMQTPRQSCPDARDLLPALQAMAPTGQRPAASLNAVAAINYTGGTTGIPKGCMHTQQDMIYTAASLCTCLAPFTPADVNLCFLPMFWIAGEDIGIIGPIFSGSTCVLFARWEPATFMAAVARYKVTDADGTVDSFVEVMNHPQVDRYDLRSLRRTRAISFVKGLTKEYRERWRSLTGTTMIQATYGSTETHTMDAFTRGMQVDDADLRPRSSLVGFPVPGTEFKICDFATRAIKPLGAEGEICVRSPSLMKGYWNNDEETRRAVIDGWFHTGDIGFIDESGYLHYLGRGKEMLKVKGMSVFPTEVEGLLMRHPAVARAGVTGTPHGDKGEVPVAFVILADEWQGRISETELVGWCRDNMASFKVPTIYFVTSLPMTATGKVRRSELVHLLPSFAPGWAGGSVPNEARHESERHRPLPTGPGRQS